MLTIRQLFIQLRAIYLRHVLTFKRLSTTKVFIIPYLLIISQIS